MSNIHELIRVVNGIFHSTRTTRTGRETMVYVRVVQIVNCISLVRRHVQTSRLVRVLKQWFTNRTGCELHIISKKG